MPVHVQWDNKEKTILYLEFVAPWTWEEVFNITAQAKQMIESVPHVVDVIHDWSRSGIIPPNTLFNARNLARQRHERAGVTAAFGMSVAVMTLWSVFSRFYHAVSKNPRYYVVESLEEARHLLASIQKERSYANTP